MHDSNVPSILVFGSYTLAAHRMSKLSCCTQGMNCRWSTERLLAVCLGQQLANSLRLLVAADLSGRPSCGTANESPGKFLNNSTYEIFQSVTHSWHSIGHSNESTARTACCRHHILCRRRQPGQSRSLHSGGLERASAHRHALVDCRCPNHRDSLVTS